MTAVIAAPILGAVAAIEHQGNTRRATPGELREWEAEFEAAAHRPLRTRMRYAFIRTYKPVLDDSSYRSFDSLAEYRAWCEANLPSWLGYGRAV